MLEETSPELAEALGSTLQLTFGKSEPILVDALHTGGGVMVCAVDLSLDGRFMGRQVWLTREGDNEWILGFYDFAADEEDEGICVTINGHRENPPAFDRSTADNPLWLAAQVAGILARLGVEKLQGE